MTHYAKAPSAGSTLRQGSRLGRIVRGAAAFRASSLHANGSGASSEAGFASAKGVLALAAVLLIALALGVALAGAAAPLVTIEPASEVSFTTAKVKGEVNPEGKSTEWRFQYIAEAAYQKNLSESKPGFEGASTGPSGTASSTEAVEGELTGLVSGDTYHLRLFAENEDGSQEALAPNFETQLNAPSVTIEAPSLNSAQNGSYTFIGHVNPGAAGERAETSWHFDCTPSCGNPPGGTIAPDTSSHLVEAEVEGLEARTTYTVTLHASNGGGEATAQASFKTPAVPPYVNLPASTPTVFGQAQVGIGGFVTPANSPVTSCTFLYGPTTAYGQQVPCATHPGDAIQALAVEATGGQFRLSFRSQTTPDLPFDASAAEVQAALEGLSSIGAGNVSVSGGPAGSRLLTIELEGSLADTEAALSVEGGTVSPTLENGATPGYLNLDAVAPGGLAKPGLARAELSGLTPGATYHMKLVVSNAAGTSESADATFAVPAAEAAGGCPNEARREEQHAAFLPDCRAYEMVSPPDKEGGEVMPTSARVRASLEGDAVGFASLSGFGDVRGGGVAVDYLAERTAQPATNGWATHAISPASEATTFLGLIFSADSLYVGEFSNDLSCGAYFSQRPLEGIGSPIDGPNLYLRSDLLAPGAGSYSLLSEPTGVPAPVLNPPSTPRPAFAGMSSDCERAIFEYNRPLLPGLGFGLHLYEWSRAAGLGLAGVLPDGSPAGRSIAGHGAASGSYTPGMISPGGRRVFFADPQNGNVYMREGGVTVQMNESEKSSPEEPQPATLWLASGNGDRAFFTTSEGLVNGDDDHNGDLYMYDAEAPAGHRLTLVSTAPGEPEEATAETSGVVGSSQDGSYVYFISSGQIVPHQPLLRYEEGLYLWHNGSVRFIASFNEPVPPLRNSLADPFAGTFPMTARVSPDGRHLLFMTTRSGAAGNPGLIGQGGFAGYDHGACHAVHGCEEFYLYSADSGALACVSCNPTGLVATADAQLMTRSGSGGASTGLHLSHSLSADGRYVFFSTPEALVPSDTNGTWDAYEYDTRTAQLHLLSSGIDSSPSYFMDASPSGGDVFIATRQRLLGWDHDSGYDLYDVRVNGGLPEPEAHSAPCSSAEACRRGTAPAPAPAPVASTAEGAGNVNHRKHHRTHHKRHRRHHRHAATHGRTRR